MTTGKREKAISSEPRQFGESELAAMDVHAAEFGAAMQGRKHLAGVEQALRVEGAFQPLLLIEIDLAEHLAHQIALLDADAVLAGEHAAKLDAAAQDVGAEGLRPCHLAGLVGIVEDQGMKIAVAGVKYVGDPKLVFLRELADARQRLRQRAAWDGTVHAEIVRRDAPDRRERPPAAGPEQIALGFRSGNLAGGRAAALRNRLDAADQLVDLDAGTIELDDQKRLDVERIARMDKGFGGVDRGLVHHLHAAGDDAGADDARDAFARSLDLGKADH